MPRVSFWPSGRSYELARGGTLLRAAVRARLPMARPCRGVGVCAACRVRVIAGGDGLAAPGPLELTLAARVPLGTDERYACLAHVLGDVTITTTYW